MSTAADPTRTSWVPGAAGSGFDVDHLPFGVVSTDTLPPRTATRVADLVLDLGSVAGPFADVLAGDSLDRLLAAGPSVWSGVRTWLQDLLTDPGRRVDVRPHLHPIASTRSHLPFTVGDYVDFYASAEHASTVGRIFRPDAEPLLPNWRHLPVGYHGRSGTVVVSGTPVSRPAGQQAPVEPGGAPVFGPSRRLDVEAELGFVVGVPSERTVPLSTADFAAHVFGVVGLNDWSARDIQAWEYVPLGPMLGKSFLTSVSAWVTPLAALDHARVPLPVQEPAVLPYLAVDGPAGYDITVEIELDGVVISRPPAAALYWGAAQMLAHLTVNGASVRTGDLYGSGTISGAAPDQVGSLLELTWGGARPFDIDGTPRTFLADGDEVVLRYSAPGARGRITLGEVQGRITPTPEHPR